MHKSSCSTALSPSNLRFRIPLIAELTGIISPSSRVRTIGVGRGPAYGAGELPYKSSLMITGRLCLCE